MSIKFYNKLDIDSASNQITSNSTSTTVSQLYLNNSGTGDASILIDAGDKYIAYGRPFYGISGGGLSNEADFDLRYPILAESEDGLHWIWVGRTLSGPWKSNKSLVGSAVVIKEKSGGYRLFW